MFIGQYLDANQEPDPMGPDHPIIIIGDALSILGSLFNIVATLTFQAQRMTIGKMVLILSTMDLIANITSMLLVLKAAGPLQCRVMSFFVGVGYSGSAFWTCCFAHSLILSVKYGDINVIDKAFKKYVIFSVLWSLPISITTTAIGYLSVDSKNGMCWHVVEDVHSWKNITGGVLFGVSCFIAIGVCAYCYISSFKELKKSTLEAHYELIFYPLILIICYLPYALGGITSLIMYQRVPYPWNLIVNLLLYLQGFLNSIAYGLSGTINTICRKRCIKSARMSKRLLERDTLDYPQAIEAPYYSDPENRSESINRLG